MCNKQIMKKLSLKSADEIIISLLEYYWNHTNIIALMQKKKTENFLNFSTQSLDFTMMMPPQILAYICQIMKAKVAKYILPSLLNTLA